MRVETYSQAEIATFFDEIAIVAAGRLCELWPVREHNQHNPIPPKLIWHAAAMVEAAKDGVDLYGVLNGSRRRCHVYPRRRAWARLRAYGYGYSAIGVRVGRDHSTIMYGLQAPCDL